MRVPPGALLSDTLITITPITSIANLPLSGASFGARLQPSGLHLLRPAILSISPVDPREPTERTLGFIFDDAGTNFEVLPAVADGATVAIEVAHFSAGGIASATPADFAASIQPLISALPSNLPPTQVASLLSSMVSWLQPPPGGGPTFDLCSATTLCQQVFQIATQSLLTHRDQACAQAEAFVLAGEPFLARDGLRQVMGIGTRLVELGSLAEQAGVTGFDQPLDFTCIANAISSIVDLAREQVLNNPRAGLLALLLDLVGDAALLELSEQQAHAVATVSEVLNALVARANEQCLTNPEAGEFLIDLILKVFPTMFLDGIDPGLSARINEAFAGCRIRIDPPAATVGIGQTVQFTGTAVGLDPAGVTWSVTGGGSIDPQSGLLTAGPATGTATVVATSVADPTRHRRASVTVVNLSVVVSPSTVTLQARAVLQFSAFVTGLSNLDVVWTATGGTIDPLNGFFVAPETPGTIRVRATSVAAPSTFGEAVVTIALSNGRITTIHHPIFIGACASADLQVFTAGFVNAAMTFTVQGNGSLRNQTLIGTTTFTTWRAANNATGQIVITATSVENPNITASATLRVDPFVAAYGSNSVGSAFVVRGVDADLPDDTYRISVVAGTDLRVTNTFTATAGGGTLAGTASNGDSISVSINAAEMVGTIRQPGGTTIPIRLSHNCAP